jgi:hypothetical protein
VDFGIRMRRLVVVPLVAVVVLAGVWVTGGLLTDDELLAKAATAAWLALAGALAVTAAARWRRLAVPVLLSYAVTALAAGGFLLWTSTVDRVAVEEVVVAEPAPSTSLPSSPAATGAAVSAPGPVPQARPTLLSRGAFRSGAHSTAGVASLIRRPAGQQVVTLTRLDTSPGPDLRVYLARGDGTDVRGAVDLGGLRGNKGTQQYAVPSGVDTSGYGAVVIWCRAFSVAFGTAALSPAA